METRVTDEKREEQAVRPVEVAPEPPRVTPVGAGGGQRVTLVDVTRMSPYQKIRYGLEKR
ncbi:MAG: hypothetical protein HXX08_22825 [Chloroflexi bacterium]|uniref:Uncharacterized protein n=1 Tax=Candidatus Chlorohelix allophototropha TaxID=3003348 RepID=A0A8T7M9G2_9CHLR|nr:hypothetical protein [Chloroflexota bacterium]WJW68635.1 hypothetical protein OZ401_004249 [Chloroflexota bacterium L227-S17]